MSFYRSQLYQEDINRNIYTSETNQALFDLLENIYNNNEETNNNDYQLLKDIYSILSDEVDDEDYYDMGYDEDNDDLIEILYNYCNDFLVDKTRLALALGRYVTIEHKRHFDSYEAYHQAIANALQLSTTTEDTEEEYTNVLLSLNEIVTNDIMTKYNPIYDYLITGKIS